MAAVVVAAVVAIALITASVVFMTRDDWDTDASAEGKPSASQSPSPSPSASDEPSGIPSEEPSPSGEATEFPGPGEDDEPSEEPDQDASDVPLPSFLLRVGDCYDRSKEREAAVVNRDCDKPHDAEVVSRKKLTGTYSTDGAVRSKADSMCRTLLRNKAAKQPAGTVGGTLISYPKSKNVGKAFSYVTCSLTAGKGKKLHKPLV
ncbi:hypothetical protein JW613_30325 [Streptomyces smyrnaeus]|uniref:Septum formation-related domain-containing protein n=1 Tax=Streptomyces smyrnaeus TaxID=1387713 RepID=A0ABS3Y4G3_9ACTN|nr:hypothetical protein [Streptomyces smyrnaeus]